MTGEAGGSRARAWKCSVCTRLTVRLDTGSEPVVCDMGNCPGDLVEIPLRPSNRKWWLS